MSLYRNWISFSVRLALIRIMDVRSCRALVHIKEVMCTLQNWANISSDNHYLKNSRYSSRDLMTTMMTTNANRHFLVIKSGNSSLHTLLETYLRYNLEWSHCLATCCYHYLGIDEVSGTNTVVPLFSTVMPIVKHVPLSWCNPPPLQLSLN